MRLSIVSFVLLTAAAHADVRLPRILSDGCVLQQNTNAAIFGFASAGEAVSVKASWGATGNTKAGPDGRWIIKLKTPNAADAKDPQSFVVTGNNTVTVSDVLIGEVWLCGGQSNMEWPVRASSDAAKEIANGNDASLKLFRVEQEPSLWPRADNRASWTPTTPDTVKDFSAVGYSFGRELRAKLGVPVGLIHCNWGGTRIEPWLSEQAAAQFPHTREIAALMESLRDPVRRGQVARTAEERWWSSFDQKGPAIARGLGPSWKVHAYDDSAWKPIPVPASWNDAMGDNLGAFDGVMYLRASFDVPQEWAGKPATLTLGPIDDRDDASINGTPIGSTHGDGQWNNPRQYDIKSGVLIAGKNILAVRVLDTSGPGGIGGPGSKPEMLAVKFEGGPSIPLAGTWKYLKGASMAEIGNIPATEVQVWSAPSYLYNGMIATLTPHTLRGALWYQGESNRGDGPLYGSMLTALFADWRKQFQSPDMAFGVVQLAPFTYGGDRGETAIIREQQASAVARDKAAGLAITMDIGDPKDIHPTNKREVGRRLALWARAKIYGESSLAHRGPTLQSSAVEGSSIRITFAEADALKTSDGQAPRHFLIASDDKRFVRAEATIEKDAVVVRSPAIAKPVHVRYAWDEDCETNLISGSGLPAAPFRTDDWTDAKVDLALAVEPFRGTDEGLNPIFDGKNLFGDAGGWVNVNCAPSTFTVAKDEAGSPIIRCTGVPTGVIRTKEMYENFILELEWRHLQPGGNAGLFVWSDALTARGQPFTRSVEVQIMDGLKGDWYTSDGDIFPIHGAKMTPLNPRPNGGDRAYPTEARMNPSPAWNHYRVVCQDGEISLAVNGKVVTRGKNCSPRKGYICLESEGGPIDFRNIRLKKLEGSTTPLEPAQIAQAADGWVPLYNGLNLDGWKAGPGMADHWKPEDWTLSFDGKADHLWSSKSYKDFELIADWRWSAKPKETEVPVILPTGETKKDASGNTVTTKVMSAGDSGIYLRGSDKSQINIWCWPIGSGEVYGYRTDPAMPPEIKAGVTPKAVADRPIGEWNRFHAIMKGDLLTVTLNGVKVLDQAKLPGVKPEGPIALQNHGDPIQFANIFIRELN